MSRAAVICEFNPFHNGHKFLLEKIKEEYADEIVCVMSGSFVQRGDIAITDKYARTEAALKGGADMAVELPTIYAVSSAKVFAENGVRLAYELGCDTLCFGAENSMDELTSALSILDSPKSKEVIAALMKAGDYYPRALSESVGPDYADLLTKPNNILAFEYIRACKKYGLTPVAIRRKGAAHDSYDTAGDIASGTLIRDLIEVGGEYGRYTPMRITSPALLSSIEPIILYKLRTMKPGKIAKLAEVSEGLENRIAEMARMDTSLSELLRHLKTKRYTMARLSRIAIYAALSITREIQNTPAPYIRVLGVRAEKKTLISSRSLPLIVDVRRGYDSLDDSAKEIFDIDIKASELMSIASKKSINEFSAGLIVGSS